MGTVGGPGFQLLFPLPNDRGPNGCSTPPVLPWKGLEGRCTPNCTVGPLWPDDDPPLPKFWMI